MTIALAWIVGNLLVAALLLSQARDLVLAAGWLLIAVVLIAAACPVLIACAAGRRLGLAVPE